MKNIFYIFFVCAISAFALPNHGDVKGKIIDKVTKEPMLGVNVFLEHTTIGAATNQAGEFHLTNAPVGRYHVVASMIGYKMIHKTVEIRDGQVETIDFDLEPTILEMGAIVITGTATPHIYEDMPVRTEVIPQKLIEMKQAINLSQALSMQTGIRVENNCANCNFSQVRILGFDGKYTQILIDGDPVVSSLAGVYGLDHFPEEMISQIEVVKGGGSALYGGGAVAGTINLITRRPLINQISMKYKGFSTGDSPDQQVSGVAEVISRDKKSGAYIFGSMRQRTPYDHNGDDFSEIGRVLHETVGFNWYWNPVENGELLTHFHRIHEDRRGGNDFDLPPHEADIAEWVEHWRSGGTVRWQHRPSPLFDYRAYYSFSLIDRETFYGGLADQSVESRLEALTFYGRTQNPTHVMGAQANYNLGHQVLTGGFQYQNDHIDDKTTASSTYHINETYENFGLFLQDNFHFFDEEQLEIIVGGRVDKHSKVDKVIFSPRINTKIQFAEGFTGRLAYTTGFKAPQTFDEDLHIDVLAGDQRIIRNSENLSEEKSRTFSGGVEYQGNIGDWPILAAVTGFYTNLYDAYAEVPRGHDGDVIIYERINSQGAQMQGVELDLGIRPITNLELRSGFTFKKDEYDEPVEILEGVAPTKDFMRTPDVFGYVRASLNVTPNFDIFTALNYTGQALVPHERVGEIKQSKTFTEIDMGLSYNLSLTGTVKTKLTAGVKNLSNAYQDDIDKGPDRDPYYLFGPTLPRTVYSGIEILF